MLVELRRARDDGAVGRDNFGSAPEGDPILVPDPVRVDDVDRQVLRVETVHEPARLGGAEVAPLGDTAAGTRGRAEHQTRAGRGEEIGRRDVPEVFADRDAGRPAGRRERLEAVTLAEVTAVVEDAVRR